MSELARMSRRARSAVKLVDGLASFSRCWMFSAPTDQPPTRPVRRVPASSGIASPVGDRPICRLKKKIMSCDAFWRPPPRAAATAGVARPELEHAGVLEEEVALLREEQVEARQVDLLLVGLDLREVGVDGEVPRQARGHAVLHVEAGVVVLVERRRPASLFKLASAYGLTRMFAPGLQALQPLVGAGHRHARQLVDAAQRRPVAVLVAGGAGGAGN